MSIVTVVPLTLQTLEVAPSTEKETGKLLVLEALTGNVPPLDQVCVAGAGKLMIWVERASTVCEDESAKPESFVARTTKVYVPAVVGVPVTAPRRGVER